MRTLKISIPVADSARLDALTGVSDALATKIRTALLATELGFEIEILTALVPENIGHLSRFVDIIERLPGARWVPLRLESSPTSLRPVTRHDIQNLAEEVDRLMRCFPGKVPGIRLATPFCAVDPIELGARVLHGRADDCGPFRSLTVDSSGRLVSCYSCRVPIRRTENLESAQNDPEVLRLRSAAGLPSACRACHYVERCMGGCASEHARHATGDGAVDYLAVCHDA